MRLIRLAILAFLALLPPAVVAAQPDEVVVRGDVARIEIERILNADNVDAARISPREVAETIAAIGRGRAPDDFWEAYQAHVRAWQRLADAFEAVQRQQGESTFVEGWEELAEAERAIETTFYEVERVALRCGARLPTPRANILPTI